MVLLLIFFFSSRRRHTRCYRDWSSDVCSSDLFAFGKFSIQAFIQANKLGWRPQVYVNAVSSASSLMTIADLTGAKAVTRGAVSVVFFKDPSDPRWASDPGIKLFQTIS